MYRIGLYVATARGHTRIKWEDGTYMSSLEVGLIVAQKNIELSVSLSSLQVGDRFYMYEKVGHASSDGGSNHA